MFGEDFVIGVKSVIQVMKSRGYFITTERLFRICFQNSYLQIFMSSCPESFLSFVFRNSSGTFSSSFSLSSYSACSSGVNSLSVLSTTSISSSNSSGSYDGNKSKILIEKLNCLLVDHAIKAIKCFILVP